MEPYQEMSRTSRTKLLHLSGKCHMFTTCYSLFALEKEYKQEWKSSELNLLASLGGKGGMLMEN